MGVPSSAIVFSGQSGGRSDGTGAAAVLDQHPDFLPYAQRIYENKRAEDVERAKQEREAAKEFQKVLKGPDLGAVPLRAQQQIQEGLTKYKQLALDMGTGKIRGKNGRKLNPLDPYDLEAASLLQAEELKLKSLKAAADNQDERIREVLKESSNPKYSKKHLTERLGALKEAKTIEDVEAWMETNPLKVNRGTIDIVNDLAPKLFTAISENGNKTTLSEAITKDNTDILVEDYLNTEQGLEDLEAGVIDGRWKDEEGMKEAIYKSAAAQNPGKQSTTFDEPKVSQASGSGSDSEQQDLVGTPSYNPNFTGEAGKTNVVTYTPKTQNFKGITFYDGTKPYNAGMFTIHPDTRTDEKGNTVTGFVVEAEVLPDPPTEPPKLREGASDSEKEVYRSQKSKYDAANDLYESGRKVKKKFWVSNVPGANGNDNYNIITKRTGVPPEQMVGLPVGAQPTEPAQGEMTQDQWNDAWSKLKSGETMVGLDGKTYKKK